jgi:hypothetical protein
VGAVWVSVLGDAVVEELIERKIGSAVTEWLAPGSADDRVIAQQAGSQINGVTFMTFPTSAPALSSLVPALSVVKSELLHC